MPRRCRWDGRPIQLPCGERRRRAARAPKVPGQGLDPAEPVMYLPWTGDGPGMYPPYTCVGDMRREKLLARGYEQALALHE